MASVFYVDERAHFEALQSSRTERRRQLNATLVLLNITTWLYAAVAGLSTLG